MKKENKYEIIWIDTYSQSGWWNLKDIKESAIKNKQYIRTCGYFVGEFGHYYVLVASLSELPDDGNDYGYPKFIPVKCVRKIIKLT